MSRVPVLLMDGASGGNVEAELDMDLGPHDLDEVEESWGPQRREGARRLVRAKGSAAVPQHWHWDWRRKGPLLRHPTYRCLGIRCQSQMQGIVLVDADQYRARLEPDRGKPLMYIEFVEVAPWNNSQFVAQRRFLPVGPRLIEAVIRLSDAEGYHGRTGLHALPQSEMFYDRCGMTRLELDLKKENLRYYEMTREQAHVFLSQGGRP
jgi:hypothetical protein